MGLVIGDPMPIVVVVVDSVLGKLVGVRGVPIVVGISEGLFLSVIELPVNSFKGGFGGLAVTSEDAAAAGVAFTDVSWIDRPSEDNTLCHLF